MKIALKKAIVGYTSLVSIFFNMLSPLAYATLVATPARAEVATESALPVESASPTPTPTVEPSSEASVVDETLSIAVLPETEASSVLGADLVIDEDGAATLATDKTDYSPVDTALITGTRYVAQQTYSLSIWSDDEPAVRTTVDVVANEEGEIAYAYQLDGNYRPDYYVEVKTQAGEVIASIHFSDSRWVVAATVNGSSSTTVDPSAAVSTEVMVATWNGILDWNNDWRSTSYQIGSDASVCIDNTNHNNTGIHTEGFSMTAPVNPGVYSVTFQPYSNNNCTGGTINLPLTLGNAITVNDIVAPVITLAGTSPVVVERTSVYVDAGATATDNYDGDLTGSIVISSNVNTNVVGTYAVTYDVVDAAGNAAATVTRTVNVVDTTAPAVPTGLGFRNMSNTQNYMCDAFLTRQPVIPFWDANTDDDFANYEYTSFHPNGSIGLNTQILTDNELVNSWMPPTDGAYGFAVRSVDATGNKSAWAPVDMTLAGSCKINYDSTAPVVDILTPTTSLIRGTIAIHGAVEDVNPMRYYMVIKNIGGAVVAGPGTVYESESFSDRLLFTWNTNLLADGQYTIHLAARDLAGNRTAVSEDNKIVTVDNTLPSTPSINHPAPEQYFNTQPILNSWTTSSDNSGIKEYHVEYIYDDEHTFSGGPTRTVTTTSRNHVPALWEQGGVTIRVRAVDNVGNIGEYSDPIHYYYDATSPVVTYPDTNPADGVITNNNDQTFVATINEPVAMCTLIINGETSYPMSKVEGDSQYWSVDVTDMADGSYDYSVTCQDLATNEGVSSSRSIVIDTTAPVITATTVPVSPDASNNWFKTRPELTLTVTDVNPDTSEYQWGGMVDGSWTTYVAPFMPSAEGKYMLYFRALDKAGNYSEVGSREIKWDQTDLTKAPFDLSVSPNPTPSDKAVVTWKAAEDAMGISKYEVQWRLGDTVYQETVGGDVLSREIDRLTEGDWKITVRAFDDAGNNLEANVGVRVDRTAPSAPTLALGTVTADKVGLAWNSVEGADDYSIWYGTSSGNYAFGARVGNTTTFTVEGLGAGNYYFAVKAHDAAGNVSGYSNEVNTAGSGFIGDPNATPGEPADDFLPAEEVLGEQTDETPEVVAADEAETLGESVLGTSTNALWGMVKSWWWLWILILVAIYTIYRYLRNKED